MFNKLRVCAAEVTVLPRGNNLKSAIYMHAYGASLGLIKQKTGVSKRRLKKYLSVYGV